MKIVINGNSIPLQIYPKEQGALTFGQILAKEYEVVHSCFTKATVKEGLRYVERNIINYFPDWVILCYGIVECFPFLFFKRMAKNTFKKYLEGLIRAIRMQTNAKIILLGILPTTQYWIDKFPVVSNNIYSFNKILNEIAKEYEITFLDLSDMDKQVSYQGFHTNQAGHIEIAKKIDEVMKWK